MAQESAQTRSHRQTMSAEAGGDKHGRGAFERIADECGGSQVLASSTQHIGGADIAGADGADVRRAGQLRNDEPERHRAGQIAKDEHDSPVGKRGEKMFRVDHCVSRSGIGRVLFSPPLWARKPRAKESPPYTYS